MQTEISFFLLMKVKSKIEDIKLGVNLLAQNIKEELHLTTEEKLGSKKMEWTTLYITGEEGFKPEVARRLDGSDLNFMPGYLGNPSESDHDMYWVDKEVDIRSFKHAIGAKTIWKYRVRVYSSLEAFVNSQNEDKNSLTDKDLALIQEMRKPRKAS